jgi:DNA-damage-inducible protein J
MMNMTPPNTKRILLTKVSEEKALPLAPEVPNAATRAAMEEARAMSHARFVSLDELINDIEKD